MIQRSLIERKCSLYRDDDFRAAGMADEAVDIVDGKPHARQNGRDPRLHMLSDEIRNRALEDHAESLGVDTPPHDT